MHRFHLTPPRAALLTGVYVFVWLSLVITLALADAGKFGDLSSLSQRGANAVRIASWMADPGGWVVLYGIGMLWTIYLLERIARKIEIRKRLSHVATRANMLEGETPRTRERWNPFDPAAPYYSGVPSAICFVLLLPVATLAWMPKVEESVDPTVLSLQWDYRLASMPPHVKVTAGVVGPLTQVLKFSEPFHVLRVPAIILIVVALGVGIAQSRRVRQSLSLLTVYSLLFLLLYFLAHMFTITGDEIVSDLPAGGGNDSIKATSVKVQKVVRKKYVVNPYSSILFAAPPPIDKIELKLTEETAERYKAGSGPGGLGQGDGKGGGFGSGTGMGKYELIRLQHSDTSWNKNFGIGGDRNLLAELKAREPLVKISEEDKTITYPTLARAAPKKPFPIIYIGGAHGFAPSENERKILREYLIDKHGMVLGDNLGGHGFHHAFVNEMTRITGVQPVEIPRDDRINQRPYDLPLLPILVSHAPKPVALGWKIDGRWAVYYHPGALSDLWRDDHAGAKKPIWESGYQLGINILFYAYAEQDKWRQAQQANP